MRQKKRKKGQEKKKPGVLKSARNGNRGKEVSILIQEK